MILYILSTVRILPAQGGFEITGDMISFEHVEKSDGSIWVEGHLGKGLSLYSSDPSIRSILLTLDGKKIRIKVEVVK